MLKQTLEQIAPTNTLIQLVLILSVLLLLCCVCFISKKGSRKPEQSLVRKRIKQIMSEDMDLSDVDWTDERDIKQALLKLNGKTYSALTDAERTLLNRALSLRFYRVDDVLSKEELACIQFVEDVEPTLYRSSKVLKTTPKSLSKNIRHGLFVLKQQRTGTNR